MAQVIWVRLVAQVIWVRLVAQNIGDCYGSKVNYVILVYTQ